MIKNERWSLAMLALLKSERARRRTNRLGGRVMLAVGAAIAAGSLIGITFSEPVALAAVAVGTVAWVVVLSVYSCVQWRMDPEREE